MTGWLDLSAVTADTRVAFVVVPYAGAVGPLAPVLAAELPGDVAVLDVHLPGHTRRRDEPLLTEPAAVVQGLLDAVRALPPELQLVLGGYSVGARLAYETTARLDADGTPPLGQVLCMARGPHTGLGHARVSHLPPEQFAAAAVRVGLAHPMLQDLPGSDPIVAALQADLRIVETLPPALGPRPAVPTAVVGAEGDWFVDEPSLRAWADVLAAPVTQYRVPGGHLAVHESSTAFGATVATAVAALRAERDVS